MSDLAIIEEVWPAIEVVNQALPAFAQIHYNFVQIVRTPFPRTPKGTLARHEIERSFAKEISSVYQASVISEAPSSLPIGSLHLDGTSEGTVRAGVRKAIRIVSPGLELEEITDKDSLLGHGFDSLHVIRLSRLLSSAFPSSPVQVDISTIYAYPSVAQLGHVLWSQLQNVRRGYQETDKAHILQTKAVSQMLAKHLPSFAVSREKPKEYVILTGTTGALGSYLLDVLCKNDRVAKVWCFNRSGSADAACRQAELAQSRGLSLDWKGKVRFVRMDLTSEALGLSQEDRTEIRDQATIMIRELYPRFDSAGLDADY